ncbi:hypothetical protein [Povalibacter sp.]|uniref:hypothetical protein n=1 Tax=Povalibacter sp. TaxID=1962978 RepID=UPI002F3FC6F8
MTIQDTMQTTALDRVIREARRAQRDAIGALDRLDEVHWPQHTEAVGDVLHALRAALCTLSSRLARIEIDAENGIPEYDEGAELDRLVTEHLARKEKEESGE